MNIINEPNAIFTLYNLTIILNQIKIELKKPITSI